MWLQRAKRIGGRYRRKEPVFSLHLLKSILVKLEVLARPLNSIRAGNRRAGKPLVLTIPAGPRRPWWSGRHIICSRKWRRWNVNKPNSNRAALPQPTAYGWWTSDSALMVGLNLRSVTITRETRFALNTFR